MVNLSSEITSGMVARKTGMVSTAELTIRNPDMRFTKGSRTTEGPFFRPMDPITIWLERIRGFPVQVFTGYLDQTPYLQLYPGTVTLGASCTLKKLLHVYWDPALPFVHEFMGKYGWVSKDGSLVNLAAESASQQGQGADNSQLQIMQDGSIGLLLYAVLTEVADWPDKHIHIERLPDKLMEKIMNIYQVYNADAAEMRDTVEDMLRRYLGTSERGSGGLSSDGNLKGGSNPEKAFNFFRGKGWTDEQAAGAVGGMMFESTAAMDPKIVNGIGATGIAQWLGGRLEQLMSRKNPLTLATQLDFIWWELHNTETVTLNNMRQTRTLDDAILVWARDYERAEALYIAERTVHAKNVYASFAGTTLRESEDDEPGARSGGDQILDAQRQGARGDDTDKIYSPFGPKKYPITPAGPSSGTGYGDDRGDHIHSGVDVPVPCGEPCIAPFDGTITHTSTSGFGTAGGMIHLRADKDVAGLNKGDKIGWGHVSAVHVAAGRKVKAGDKIATSGGSPCHVHFVYITGGASTLDGNADPTAVVQALQKGEAVSGNDAGGGGSGGDNASSQDILTAAKSAAFVQDLAFPSFMETTEAMMLTGQRSLLNDRPLFPFVEQLSKAALRDFQSLPNGDFYAFYPDYFGHMRDRSPYWEIDDIEILDAQIQLTDETLATHVFGVGDTTHPASPGIDHFDRIFNTGIINIGNVDISGFNPTSLEERASDEKKDKDQKARDRLVANNPQEVMRFLSKYGARPWVEEAPFVRSPFFEAFVAWQTFNLMWSRQFATTATVTFMPELYPGGLVSFPRHDLQVYVESVTHTFSYADGFTTEVEISAPASLSRAGNNDDPLSFGLVRGGDS
jgi:murein DD-endopeptidase MepM/ murein hydrolase activator NlpD